MNFNVILRELQRPKDLRRETLGLCRFPTPTVRPPRFFTRTSFRMTFFFACRENKCHPERAPATEGSSSRNLGTKQIPNANCWATKILHSYLIQNDIFFNADCLANYDSSFQPVQNDNGANLNLQPPSSLSDCFGIHRPVAGSVVDHRIAPPVQLLPAELDWPR